MHSIHPYLYNAFYNTYPFKAASSTTCYMTKQSLTTLIYSHNSKLNMIHLKQQISSGGH